MIRIIIHYLWINLIRINVQFFMDQYYTDQYTLFMDQYDLNQCTVFLLLIWSESMYSFHVNGFYNTHP